MSMLMIEVLTFLLFPIRLPVTDNSNLSGLLHYGCGPLVITVNGDLSVLTSSLFPLDWLLFRTDISILEGWLPDVYPLVLSVNQMTSGSNVPPTPPMITLNGNLDILTSSL